MRDYYQESIDAAIAELGWPSGAQQSQSVLQRAHEILIDTRCPLNDPAWNNAFARILNEIELAESPVEMVA